jgi:quinol monooxygenase YgiN
MIHVLVHLTVKDFQAWKKMFDGNAVARRNAGSLGGHVFPTLGDQNEVFILYEWDTPEHAREFFQSPGLRQLMSAAGVIGNPHSHILTAGERIQA